MAFLCISNGRSSIEVVKLIEGKLWQIDKETVKFLDSNQIREKYKKKKEEFQLEYPDFVSESIRIFDPENERENGLTVLYKKHIIAFREIIKNHEFMNYLCKTEYAKERNQERNNEKDPVYINGVVRKGILYRNFNSSIEAMLRNLRSYDKQNDGVNNGGNRYYSFIRYVIIIYEYYLSVYNKNLPTVNDYYQGHLSILANSKLQKEVKYTDIIDSYIYEESSKYPSYKERGIITETDFIDQPNYEKLMNPEPSPYIFFSSDQFDRYFYSYFLNDHINIFGNLESLEGYRDLYDICDRCFNGIICCPSIGKNYNLYEEFNNSIMNIFCLEEKNRQIDYAITQSTINQVPTIIISENKELLESYQRKYKIIITIYNDENNKDQFERELIDVFIKLYNDEYKKVHSR